jgi:vitamin B12 transporter
LDGKAQQDASQETCLNRFTQQSSGRKILRLQSVIYILSLFVCAVFRGQSDSISIDEVVVSDALLRDYSQAQKVIRIPDSILRRDPGSVTRLLQFHSPIHFKENGFGMASSPAFRGTTAQHTAVVWNGINLNSALDGQTDFNALAASGNWSVRPGGGSVLFGSSAIGGTVHYFLLTDR